MMSISWAMLTSAIRLHVRGVRIDQDASPSSTATPTRSDIATSMRAYLRDSSELVDLDDTSGNAATGRRLEPRWT